MEEHHTIAKVEAFSFRYPISVPVETSFGRMSDRPAVFIRIEAEDRCFGWGEVFANWPAAGAEHRVNLLERDIAQLVVGRSFTSPPAIFDDLTRKTHIRALQCGEWGPFQQVIAGIDTALWDLKARAAGLPLRKLLNPEAADTVPAYASGIHIGSAIGRLDDLRAAGYSALKVKIGFDFEEDRKLLAQLSEALSENEQLFTDANQAFDTRTAKRFIALTSDLNLGWLEEPIAADAPWRDWAELASLAKIPLAAGENIAGEPAFTEWLERGYLRFVQPDVAKWGGVTGCHRVAKQAVSSGHVYCPHFLGAGIGLAASAEILAAVGGEGLLEVDANPNPLREAFRLAGMEAGTGQWATSMEPGLGIPEIPAQLAEFRTHAVSISKKDAG